MSGYNVNEFDDKKQVSKAILSTSVADVLGLQERYASGRAMSLVKKRKKRKRMRLLVRSERELRRK